MQIAVRKAAESPPLPSVLLEHAGGTFFTAPKNLVAGEAATMYFNRVRAANGLAQSPNIKMMYGFNGWHESGTGQLLPSNLHRDWQMDWWSTRIVMPKDAQDFQFVFNDGGHKWDNNNGADYTLAVKGAVQQEVLQAAPMRQIVKHEKRNLAGGTIHVIELEKRSNKAGRWQEERTLRVWTPPGYDADNAPPEGYPVMYIADGQNIFEDNTAHQGVSWRAADAVAGLMAKGEMKPVVLVGIDGTGVFRSFNYLPYPPGTGAGGFRTDCARWPGGGLDAYMERLIGEYLPLMQSQFAIARDRKHTAFGGASFGGIAALQIAQKAPDYFGSVLAESPSLWVNEGRYLDDMLQHTGPLPDRMFVGAGTREYSATRDHERGDVDKLLLHYAHECARILGDKGLKEERLRFQVDPGAGHHESAWAWRFPGAMQFLFGQV